MRFDSLQTGKRIASVKKASVVSLISLGFDSLQTGKRIARMSQTNGGQREVSVSIPFKRESVLQDYQNITQRRCRVVSIPFKRESVLQVPDWNTTRPTKKSSFDSLQTGKRIASAPILSPVGPWLRKPKNIRELRQAISKPNFTPKIPQTRVYTEPYAIFHLKRL